MTHKTAVEKNVVGPARAVRKGKPSNFKSKFPSCTPAQARKFGPNGKPSRPTEHYVPSRQQDITSDKKLVTKGAFGRRNGRRKSTQPWRTFSFPLEA